MTHPADDKTQLLRERLDRLAYSVSGGDGIDGAQLYRQGVRRRRRRLVATTGLIAVAVVIVGAAIGSAVRPEASSDPSSPTSNSDCEVPGGWMPLIERGTLTEEEVCQRVRERWQEVGTLHFPEGPSLVIEGHVHEDSLAECRAGTYDSGDGAADLYCNAMLMIAAGKLEPAGTCGPPGCPAPGTPLWTYGEAELRDLAEANK